MKGSTKKISISILVLFFSLAGCGTGVTLNSPILRKIDDRGPIALSPENPYLIANLALAREIETSPVLRGFIAGRGVPYAIEVYHSLLTPYHFTLYYPKIREAYILERSDTDWLVQGPMQISQDKLKDVILLTQSMDKEPKLLKGEELKAAITVEPSAYAPTPKPSASVPAVPSVTPSLFKPTPAQMSEELLRRDMAAIANKTPTSTPAAVPSVAAEQVAAAGSTVSALPREAAVRTDTGSVDDDRVMAKLAESKSNHPAELSPKGDVVHYVTLTGENLSIIARWYTYDRSNADRIARINGISDPNAVTIGDTVIVPAYLVKNKNRLTPSGLEWLQDLARDEKNSAAGR